MNFSHSLKRGSLIIFNIKITQMSDLCSSQEYVWLARESTTNPKCGGDEARSTRIDGHLHKERVEPVAQPATLRGKRRQSRFCLAFGGGKGVSR